MSVCAIHRTHSPGNLSVELHHVVPVSWQQRPWQPVTAPDPGVDQAGRGKLWDARTVVLCPTGHRNVHVWIVRFMKALTGEEPAQAFTAVKGASGGQQAATALQALVRFKEAGGALQALVAAREWGES